MFYVQPVDIMPTLSYQSQARSVIKPKKDMSGLPYPEIQLIGPPVISTTTEMQGSLHIDLTNPKSKGLEELSIKLEALATTWSSGSHTSHRQRKRLYVERQTLWKQSSKPLTSGKHSFEYTFAMPPGYLPPSFRFNSHIYIQYRIRAVAKFPQGKRRTTFNLEHHPLQPSPEEQWGLAAAQNWITIQSGYKRHPLTRTQALAYSKMGTPAATQVADMPKLGLKDKIRGRRLYPIRLDAMFLESGVFVGTSLDSIQVQLIRDVLPLVELSVQSVQASLAVITEVSVNKRKYVDRKNILLIEKKVNHELPGEVAVDITEMFGSITLPNVDPSFDTKTLSRSYKLVLCCEVMADEISSEVFIVLPITVLGNSREGLLPVYQKDAELPSYDECVPYTP